MNIDVKELRIFIERNIPWFIASILLVIFVAIAEDVIKQELLPMDQVIQGWIQGIMTPMLTSFFMFITDFGGASIFIIISLFSLFIAKKKKFGMSVTINLLIIFLLNVILKNIFQRPRPDEAGMLIEETGFSFPSGHSMVSMAFYGYLMYLAYRRIENPYLRYAACISLGLLICLIGISRVYLGVHYPSDVFSGFCLAIAYLIVYIKVSNYVLNH